MRTAVGLLCGVCLALLLVGCDDGSSSSIEPGRAGGACYGNNTCDLGLICDTANVCISEAPEGDVSDSDGADCTGDACPSDLHEELDAPCQDDAACDSGMACVDGSCVCPSSTFCDNACVDFDTSSQHCGGCGQACGARELCTAGTCVGPPAGYVFIPAGSFMMGTPDQGFEREVTLTHDFLMKETEVTQEEWQAAPLENGYPNFSGPTRPMEYVNWGEALAYANWLSESQGLVPCYDLSECWGIVGTNDEVTCPETLSFSLACEGYRLPTEAEWEYAARAGSTTVYANGDTEADLALMGWYTSNSNNTHTVAALQSNAWGLFDMHGNVWEWTWDPLVDTLLPGPVTDPIATEGYGRVIRGGAWNGDAPDCSSARRMGTNPVNRLNTIGFRLVRTVN